MLLPAKVRGVRRLRAWAVALPVVLILAVEVVRGVFLAPWLGPGAASRVAGALVVVGVVVFAWIMWRFAEQAEGELAAALHGSEARQRQLVALHDAALSVTSALDLPTVLRRVVDESRAVIGSRYGALAVLTPDGKAIDAFVTSGIDAETERRLGAPPTGHGLLGVVIAEGRVLRVDDIGAHPLRVGFPPNHPPMRTLLAVPLAYQGATFGRLYLADREDGQPFDADDEETLQRFGAQAVIAVANARLSRELQRLSLVGERERISMDLHDGVMQTLYATGLGLEAVLDDITDAPETARAGVEQAIERLHSTIADIRYYIFDLRATQRQSGGSLAERLRAWLAGLQAPGVAITLGGGDLPETLSPRVEWECWHVAREAVSNAVRHARCQHIALDLRVVGAELQLRVVDDGSGFDNRDPRGEGHHGLQNMRRRAEAVGGSLEVDSVAGGGTRLTLTVPLREPAGALHTADH